MLGISNLLPADGHLAADHALRIYLDTSLAICPTVSTEEGIGPTERPAESGSQLTISVENYNNFLTAWFGARSVYVRDIGYSDRFREIPP